MNPRPPTNQNAEPHSRMRVAVVCRSVLSLCSLLYLSVCSPAAALCVMVAASVYTAERTGFQIRAVQEGNYGYSFVLAWVAFPMTFISGLMYLVLRKRK